MVRRRARDHHRPGASHQHEGRGLVPWRPGIVISQRTRIVAARWRSQHARRRLAAVGPRCGTMTGLTARGVLGQEAEPMFESIVVPLDLEAGGDRALPIAGALAR